MRIQTLAVAIAVLLLGCASSAPRDPNRIRLGMTKDEVRAVMGKPTATQQSTERGEKLEIWEYPSPKEEAKSGTDVAKKTLLSGIGFFDEARKEKRFRFYFTRGRLARWGTETKSDTDTKPKATKPKNTKPKDTKPKDTKGKDTKGKKDE